MPVSGASFNSSTSRSRSPLVRAFVSISASTIAPLGKDAVSDARTLMLRLRTGELDALVEFSANLGQVSLSVVEEIEAGDAPTVVEEASLPSFVVKVVGLVDAIDEGRAENIRIGGLQRPLRHAEENMSFSIRMPRTEKMSMVIGAMMKLHASSAHMVAILVLGLVSTNT